MDIYEVFIHFRTPYIKCEKCKECTIFRAPWEHIDGSHFTIRFEKEVLQSAAEGTAFKHIGRRFNIDGHTVNRIVNRVVDRIMSSQNLSDVTSVAVDETKLGSDMYTIFTNIDTKIPFAMIKGMDSSTFKKMIDKTAAQGFDPLKIKHVTMDMSGAFKKGARLYFPNAKRTVDKFHVVKDFNKHMDTFVRAEQVRLSGAKGALWAFRFNSINADDDRKNSVREICEEYESLAVAYELKKCFENIYANAVNRKAARFQFNALIKLIKKTDIEPLKVFARTLKRHFDGILNYFNTRLTNAIAESINTTVKRIKRVACGMRDMRSFIHRIYLSTASKRGIIFQ
ncbi:ISL3 family transposase ISMac21 [Clostridia bacterium]|nr:ISL3 family transposase ISMac21 [Clostridia bacterium]